jgi:hypothetical protein
LGFLEKGVLAELWIERDLIADEAGTGVGEEFEGEAAGGGRGQDESDLAALAGQEAVLAEESVALAQD